MWIGPKCSTTGHRQILNEILFDLECDGNRCHRDSGFDVGQAVGRRYRYRVGRRIVGDRPGRETRSRDADGGRRATTDTVKRESGAEGCCRSPGIRQEVQVEDRQGRQQVSCRPWESGTGQEATADTLPDPFGCSPVTRCNPKMR